MKVLKIDKKDYVLKFNSECISNLNALGITLIGLTNDLQEMKVDNLYTTFYYGLKAMQKDMTIEEAYKVIDAYYEENEDNSIETFFEIVLEDYSKAMGLGKKFKEMMTGQKVKLKKE